MKQPGNRMFPGRDDPRRKLQSFLRHAWMVIKPFTLALITCETWVVLHLNNIAFDARDENVLIAAGITVPAALFSILAAHLVSVSYERYKTLTACVLRGDKQAFLLYRDERLPTIVHVLQVVLSLPIIAIGMGLPYASMASGIAVMFSIAFVITLYWVAIYTLQNPTESPWFAERIPQEWLDANVDGLLPAETNAQIETP